MHLNPIRRAQLRAARSGAVSLKEDAVALHKMDVRLGDPSNLGR
jgi:hypothetical protein